METNLVSLVAYGGVASALAAVLLGVKDVFFTPRETQARLRDAVRKTPAAKARRKTLIGRFDHWFERTLYLAGLPISPMAGALMLVLFGLVFGSAIFVWTENLLLTSFGAMVGMTAVIGYVLYAKSKRLTAFQEQFPAALDLLARAVRAGESLEQAIELVAKAAKNPVKNEFQRVAKHLEMGLAVSAAMQAMAERVDLMDVRIFSNTISIHRETGGGLGVTLERLATVIRDRMEYHRQLKSVTGAGRFSAIAISALGPILFGYMFLVQPEYGSALWEDPTGRLWLSGAVLLQLVGIYWVSRLLKSDY